MSHIAFNNTYARLGDNFFQRVVPTSVKKPVLIQFNHLLANELGMPLSATADDELAQIFSGNTVPAGAEPLAMAYAGHQFGHFVPQLGDGRAILLGEVDTADGGREIQLKGSGLTFFSRNGDGRAALGPVLREYLLSEAMHALGVPTTRALAAVTTGEQVVREQLLPGGVITRVASSFVRVGTFQYFIARRDTASLKALADYMIDRLYPHARDSNNPYIALLQEVVQGQAGLIARWMQLGFIHGVMNTDNVSIACETIDYGPCAFMDAYSHGRVFSSIDRNGRYAYNEQGAIGLWNVTRFAETLIPLIDDDSDVAIEKAQQALAAYVDTYNDAWLHGMRSKCGLSDQVDDEIKQNDRMLIESLLDIMDDNQADYTLCFTRLSTLAQTASGQDETLRELFANTLRLDEWLLKWRERLQYEQYNNDEQRQALMQSVNPVYIPRNHQVEAAIRAAEDHGDFSVFHELHKVLQSPYEKQPGKERYQLPPEPGEEVKQTFCGT